VTALRILRTLLLAKMKIGKDSVEIFQNLYT